MPICAVMIPLVVRGVECHAARQARELRLAHGGGFRVVDSDRLNWAIILMGLNATPCVLNVSLPLDSYPVAIMK